MRIQDYLRDHRLIADGSMGTYYSNLVNEPGAYSEHGNLSSPEIIEGIHREYIAAGAGLIRTNTFAANRHVLNISTNEQIRIVEAACNIAKKAASDARTTAGEKRKVWVLGNIGPIPADADATEEDILEEYQTLCDLFIEQGMDGIHFETFESMKYINQLIPYIRDKNREMFLLASFSLNKNGYSAAGISAARLMEQISALDGIDACGFNCGVGSGHMLQLLKKVTFPTNKYIYVSPNAGYPEQMHNRMIFMDNEAYFTDNMKQIAEFGIDIIGGCCGTTPDYIRRMVKEISLSGEPRKPLQGLQPQEESRKPEVRNEFYELFQKGSKVIAVELDPPFDAGIDHIMECAHSLKAVKPDIITFADSPMGRSRVDSIMMGIKIAEETGLRVMPHICCRDRNMISMRAGILGAYIHGIRNLLLVTGDPVPGENRTSTTGVFDYNSIRLMEYVKEMNVEHFSKEPIYYGGALSYNRGTLESVIKRMNQKIAAGAKYFLTQPLYSEEDAGRLREIKKQVDTKILCGILPLVSYRNANFIKNEVSGIHVPDEIVSRYRPDMSREEAENLGAQIANEVIEMTKDFADGYYFMLPFNRVSLMNKIRIS